MVVFLSIISTEDFFHYWGLLIFSSLQIPAEIANLLLAAGVDTHHKFYNGGPK